MKFTIILWNWKLDVNPIGTTLHGGDPHGFHAFLRTVDDVH